MWQSNRTLLACALVAISGLLIATTAVGRDIYVNNVTGDDRNQGESPESNRGALSGPCRSVGRALKAARNGDRIVIANTGEPYRECVTLQAGHHSGVEGRPFEIVGNGAVLDGRSEVPPDAWRHFRADVYRFRPRRLHHQVLYLDDKPAKLRRIEGGALPDLQPLEWCLFDGHVYFRAEKGRIPPDYDLSHSSMAAGLTLYEVRHVVVSDLIVQGFQLDGVNAHDGAMDTRLVGLVCRGNGRSGISVGGASRVQIEACLVGNNLRAQLRTEGFSRTRVIGCDLVDTDPAAPALQQLGGDVDIERAGPPADRAVARPAASRPAFR